MDRRPTVRSHEDSKLRDADLDISSRSEIWQTPRQQRDTIIMTPNPRLQGFNKSGGETSYILMNRCPDYFKEVMYK